MPQPFDYTFKNLPDPTSNMLQTLQVATSMKQAKIAEDQANLQKKTQEQLQADIAGLGPNPSAASLSKLVVKYPALSEHFKRAHDVLSGEEQQVRVNQASQVYAALQADQPDVAQGLLQEQADAYRNSGKEQEAKNAETIAKLIKMSPETARTSTGLYLASAMGQEKFTETFTKLESERREAALDPSKLTEAQARARKAAVDANFAESNAAMDLQKKGWDIYKIQEDVKISKENLKIATLNAQLNREQNELKRDELKFKLDEFKRKRDEAVQAKAAQLETGRAAIDNMLNTADRILATPLDVMENAMGPVESRLPTVRQDVADFETLMENFDAQAFIAQIPNMVGMGALSDKEGARLTAAIQSFSLRQSPSSLIKNVKETQRLMLKSRANLSRRHGMPETIPDTPEVKTEPEDINALVQKYTQPGAQ